MTRIIAVVCILVLMLTTGCAKKPNLYVSDGIMQEFEPAYFDFTYLNARARIVIEEPNGKTTKGTLNIRAKKDSLIWFSVTPGLGIEALRGVITEDKIRIKDRINGQNINMSYLEFEEKYGLSLSLNLFQNLLYANIPEEFVFKDRLIRIGQHFELTQTRSSIRYHSRVNTKHGKVEDLSSNSMQDKGALLVNYRSFQEINKQPFPNELLLKISFFIDGKIQNSIIHVNILNVTIPDTAITFPFQF